MYKGSMDFFDDGPEKPIRIWSRIGRRPLIAFGNSNGDVPMLAFAGGPELPALRLLLHHDDADREFAYDAGAEDALQTRGEPRLDGGQHQGRLDRRVRPDRSPQPADDEPIAGPGSTATTDDEGADHDQRPTLGPRPADVALPTACPDRDRSSAARPDHQLAAGRRGRHLDPGGPRRRLGPAGDHRPGHVPGRRRAARHPARGDRGHRGPHHRRCDEPRWTSWIWISRSPAGSRTTTSRRGSSTPPLRCSRHSTQGCGTWCPRRSARSSSHRSSRQLWIRLNSVAHDQLVAILDGTSVLLNDEGAVALQLQPVLAAVRQQLVDNGSAWAAHIPDVDVQYVLLDAETTQQLQQIYRIATAGFWVLLVVAIVLAGAAVWISPNHWHGLRRIALAVAFGAVILGTVLTVVQNRLADAATDLRHPGGGRPDPRLRAGPPAHRDPDHGDRRCRRCAGRVVVGSGRTSAAIRGWLSYHASGPRHRTRRDHRPRGRRSPRDRRGIRPAVHRPDDRLDGGRCPAAGRGPLVLVIWAAREPGRATTAGGATAAA